MVFSDGCIARICAARNVQGLVRISVHLYVYIYIYICMYGEREREREREMYVGFFCTRRKYLYKGRVHTEYS